jgi:hypothetical protein
MGVQLRVTTVQGDDAVLNNASIDYSVYAKWGRMPRPDYDVDGIRVLAGDQWRRVRWTELVRVTIRNAGTAKKPKLEGEIVLRDGTTNAVQFVPDSDRGLQGIAYSGGFSARLADVATIEVEVP